MQSFWHNLDKPISVLAPMYDVTDVVFREIIAQIAKPDVFFTEFINCDAFCSKGRYSVEDKLLITNNQHPVIAQIWGINPDTHFETAKKLAKMGFDGIDLNMGCPQKAEMKIGACANLINNHDLASNLIQATMQGAGKVPVSVKTRIGIKDIVTKEWVSFLLEQDLAAITLHGRTVKEMSSVPAHWDEITKAVTLRNESKKDTLIIGNGDITDFKHGNLLCKKFGWDGYMIGRGIFSNPWAFSKQIENIENRKRQLIEVAIKHLELYKLTYNNNKSYNILKKFFKMYINGYDGASDLRSKLFETQDIDEALLILQTELSLL